MKALTDRDDWYADSVIYHVYPRTFCDALGEGLGNVEGIAGKLDYLQRLHVNTIYVQDVDATLPHLADEDKVGAKERQTLSDLAKAVQEHDMHLLVDLPAAFTSPAHPWFLHALKGDAPYRDYYLWRQGRGKTGNRPPDGRKVHGKSVWRTENGTDWYLHHAGSPLLNWDCDALVEAMLGIARMLLDLGVDGFVLPAEDMHVGRFAAGKSSAERDATYARLQTFAEAVREAHPCTFVVDIGWDAISRAQSLPFANGLRSSAHLPRTYRDFRKPRYQRLKRVVGAWQQGAYGRFVPQLYCESADLPRVLSWFVRECGNYRKEAACMVATAIYMLRGTPIVYQGQEIGMGKSPVKHVSDISDARFERLSKCKVLSKIGFVNKAVIERIDNVISDSARTAMPWTALLPNAGFSAGTLRVPLNPDYVQINVQTELEKSDGIIGYYERLLGLRANAEYAPVLKNGVYKEYPQNKNLLVYSRSYKGVTVIVVCNLSCASVPFVLPDRVAFNDATLLLANYDMPAHLGTVTLRPYECMVYRLK